MSSKGANLAAGKVRVPQVVHPELVLALHEDLDVAALLQSGLAQALEADHLLADRVL
jgi:hypothetical protein